MSETTAPSKPVSRKLGWLGIAIGLLALGVGAIALLAGFNHLHTLNQRQRTDKNSLASLTQQVATLASNNAEQNTQITALQQHLQNVVSMSSRKDYDWILTEANYLVKQAQFSLEFDQNPDLAEQLLKTADNRIASLHNPSLVPVRQALMNNIQALKAVPRVHQENVLLTINALGEQIGQLPIVSDATQLNSKPSDENDKALSGWRRGLVASWRQLQQVIIVQYHPQAVNQLILPINRSYLDIHLQMLLGQAQWALLHHEQAVYQQSLKNASTWINQYYIADAAQTQSFLNTLEQLAQIQVAPSLPNLTTSVEAINSAMIILVNPPSSNAQE